MSVYSSNGLGLVKGIARNKSGATLVNFTLSVRDQITNTPVRVYAGADPSTLISRDGKVTTDATGSYAFYVLLNRSVVVRGYDAAGEVLFSSHDNQADDSKDNTALGPVAAAAVTSSTKDGALLNIAEKVYVTKAWRDNITNNGISQDLAPVAQGIHDLLREFPSLVSSTTDKSNFALLNVGQPLVRVPNATSAPYWTDPGPLLYTVNGSGGSAMPASIPNQLEFITHDDGNPCLQFSSLPGYGDAEAGKRRVQIASYQIGSRFTAVWDISFLMPKTDENKFDVATSYDYPFLLWQVKAGALPTWSIGVEATPDPEVYTLYVVFTYSSDSTDATSYRRQYNKSGSGVTTSKSNLRLATTTFRKNEWQDLRIEMFVDERDITSAAGGEGYCHVTLNNKPVLTYTGPTAQYKDAGGGLPAAPRWYLGIYRHQYGVLAGGTPANLKELDLDRQNDPAPYLRRVLIRRGRLLKV